MVLLLAEGDLEGAILCHNRIWVIPLEVVCLPVMKVDSFPIWVIAGPESATINVELVRKYQLKFLTRIVE
jgi:hypothetical protein